MQQAKRSFLLVIVGLFSIVDANSQIMVVPADLNPGDSYRLVFITKDNEFQALSSDIVHYDALVQSQASQSSELLALGTNWRVIGSTPSVDAKTHTETDDSDAGPTGVPIYRLDGQRIADNYDDLWDGSIQVPLYIDQEGGIHDTCCGTWTGTSSNGVGVDGYELGAGDMVTDGAPYATESNWIQTSPYNAAQLQYLYGISDVLTVPGATIDVAVDIRPGSTPGCGGSIPVAILGSETLDVTQVDPESVALDGLGVRERGNGSLSCGIEDVDYDGYLDLVCHIQNGPREGIITGALVDGTPIEGSDILCVAQ